MTDQDLDLLTRQVENLTPSEQLILMERIIGLLKRQTTSETESADVTDAGGEVEVWTEEELDELFKPRKPLTGKEIVEKHLATGVIGSWADMGIEDSVEWLQQQRASRKNKHQW